MNTEWRRKALCLKKNNVFWYPPLDADVPEKYYSVAREACRRCPVWKECLRDATKEPVETWGMWGGLTPQERSVIDNPAPKLTAVRPHGTWVRYRQGCKCGECAVAHNEELPALNVDGIPQMNTKIVDIDAVRFDLMS